MNHNYEVVTHVDGSDICIINTCTVTAKSDQQSRQLIRKAARSGARVIVTGCYAQVGADDLKSIDGVTHVLGNAEKSDIAKIINGLNGCREHSTVKVMGPDVPLLQEPYHSTRSRAFLKIQDGCNRSCSYCAVRKARGRSRSLQIEDVIKSALQMERDGYREIILTGVHIGSYGLDLSPKSSLTEVVHELSDVCPETRFRISSLEPSEIKSELLALLKRKNICNHLHIPLQSGSDKILNSMKRGYSVSAFSQVINKIMHTYPDISIGTDLIVGFPGETEQDFNHTMSFVDEMPFSYLHVFPYSRRPDTPASVLEGHVGEDIKSLRVKKVMELGKIKKNYYVKKHLCSTLNVIVENKAATHHYYKAISDNYLKVLVKGDGIKPGQRRDILVKDIDGTDLIAQALD